MLTFAHSPVSSSALVMGGTVVFPGTRVPTQTLPDYLNEGFSVEEFLEFFPSVQRKNAAEFLRLIKD